MHIKKLQVSICLQFCFTWPVLAKVREIYNLNVKYFISLNALGMEEHVKTLSLACEIRAVEYPDDELAKELLQKYPLSKLG